MRICYQDGADLVLAEVCKISRAGGLLICRLYSTDEDGKQEVVARPFPSEELCEQFFREVILTSPADAVIHLENTNFDLRLSNIIEDWDSLYED